MTQKNVLFADSEQIILNDLSDFLSSSGYSINTINNYHGLLKAIRNKRYQILILDSHLKHLPSSYSFDEIREYNPYAVIIMMVSDPTLDSVITFFRNRVFDLFIKPFDINEMKNSLEKGFEQYEKNVHFHFFMQNIDKFEALMKKSKVDFEKILT